MPRLRFLSLCAGLFFVDCYVHANPQGGVVTQGTATFNSQGSHLTIQTSDHAAISWSSFNIGTHETTTFVQPSSTSVVWNRINDPNPSQILGTLNANGYIVLQNQSGFFIGGQACITAHGLFMTTAPLAVPDLASGGAWQFSVPPPSAKIINYGQLSTDKGGSLFLIAHDIENHGTISADQGDIGLFAGKEVLLSERPDGKGLSAQVTLPEGSVDNSGKIIADAGTIALQAQVVNQGGLVQANSVREVNGVIQLVASDAIKLGPGSQILAKGDDQGTSPGGAVLIKSSGSFSDRSTSTIDISGGAQGGNGGQVEISAAQMNAIHSQIQGAAAAGFVGGKLLIDPYNILLASSGDTAPGSGLVNPGDPNSAGSLDTLTLDVTTFSPSLSQISLQAVNNIELSTVWTLADPGVPALLKLTAGNNITFDDGSAIKAGQNWSVDLVAGTQLTSAANRQAGSAGIYLNGNSYLQTQNGNISLWAGNEILLDTGLNSSVGNNGIRTLAGGSIDVTALYGDVNTGGNPHGYVFGQATAPYYRVSAANLGGISTAAGGDVTISAGGNVTSYLPQQNDYLDAAFDGGTGAFGPQPGNVTISAGGNVSGHYVVANGTGEISAGGDVGSPTASGGFALSLVKGTWSVSAPNGSIYVQDIRNPNGVFNDNTRPGYAGYHYFDYDLSASVLLQAGDSIEITGAGAPHTANSAPNVPIPLLFPPSLQVIAGSGGFILDSDVILFPSPSGDLHITTYNGGNFQSYQDPNAPLDLTVHTLEMSDSAAKQWDPSGNSTFGTFLSNDNAPNPPELNSPNPVVVSVSGSMKNVTLRTTKSAQITVGGDMFNAGLVGENLSPSDITSVKVAGKISYPDIYSFIALNQAIVSPNSRFPSWDAIFSLVVDPNLIATRDVPPNATLAEELALGDSVRISLRDGHTLSSGFQYDPQANPGFVYDPTTKTLGFQFRMNQNIRSILEGQMETLKLDGFGHPVLQPGQASLGQDPTKMYFATVPITFVSPALIETLYNESLNTPKDAQSLSPGLQIGGPGRLTVQAASMDLGSSHGIISWGVGDGSQAGALNYGTLAGVTPSEGGASVNVTVANDLNMLSSTIASIYGGEVSVHSQAGAVTLSLGDFSLIPPTVGDICYGIFTSGSSDVEVEAAKDINVGGARIATFNGGNVSVESDTGSVNAGNGANFTLVVPVVYRDPHTGLLTTSAIQNPRPFGSGIMAISPTSLYQTEGSDGLPGNITINTPRGDILSTLGGIQQFALNGSIAGGPTITLNAGTPATGDQPAYPGNVNLGVGGVIGGTVNITAQGSINGLIVSHQSANISAAQSFSGTLLSGGTANVNAGASVSGTIIGIGGVNASGGGGVTASVLGQNVSIGGATAQSTLGTTATASATSTGAAAQSSADAQQQVGTKALAEDDEDKKKKDLHPALMRRVGRVTVILPPAS